MHLQTKITEVLAIKVQPFVLGHYLMYVTPRDVIGEPARGTQSNGLVFRCAFGSENLPPLLGQNFELMSQLALSGESSAARNLSLALGPSRGTGEVVYTLGDAPTVTARLDFPQLNLDELIAQATPPVKDLPEAQSSGETAGTAGPATLLPPGLTGSFELGVAQLTYRGQVVQDVVSVHDLQATILHQLGLDHKRLTYRHAGRDYRLTDVHGEVVRGILA